MAPHSSTLAWKIPWKEEPGRLQSMRSLRVRHDWATSLSLFTFMQWRRKWQPTPVFLPGESQERGTGGLPSMGSHRVRHDWRDLAAAAAAAGEVEWLIMMVLFSWAIALPFYRASLQNFGTKSDSALTTIPCWFSFQNVFQILPFFFALTLSFAVFSFT